MKVLFCIYLYCILYVACASDFILYDDSIENGVQDGTYSSTHSVTSTSPSPPQGIYCISTAITGTVWGAFYFFGFSFPVSAYDGISFWYNPGTVNTQSLQVLLNDPNGNAVGVGSLNLNSFAPGGSFTVNQWTKVFINFTGAFKIPTTGLVGQFYIQTANGGAQSVFYLDYIVAVAKNFSTALGPTSAVSMVINGLTPSYSISRFIYGLNDKYKGWGTQYSPQATLTRSGGNRLTGWNWENGWSNAGSDYYFENDQDITTTATPGAGVSPMINSAFASNSTGVLLTIPCIGYVSTAVFGNAPMPNAVDKNTPQAPGTQYFMTMNPTNPAGVGVGVPHANGPVYADDFVHWVNQNYPGHASHATAPVFFSLDNEPDLWGTTHAEIRGTVGGGAPTTKPTDNSVWIGLQELVDKNAAIAAAAKSVMPNAKVFGPAHYGWGGIKYLQNWQSSFPQTLPDGIQATWYADYYLDRMKAAAGTGPRLLDVYDIHWYPEATGDGIRISFGDTTTQTSGQIDARMQAPRSFWDPTYIETSWIAQDDLGNNPINLFSRIKASIAKVYPGTAMSLSEYFFGRLGDISGAVAHADCLGIFGRDQIFAATVWPNGNSAGWSPSTSENMNKGLMAAFAAFLNYDGSGSHFGDMYVNTTVFDNNRPVDPARASQTLERITAYSSYDSTNPNKRTTVLLNKAQLTPINVTVTITDTKQFTSAQVYQVTGTNGPTSTITGPTRLSDITFTTVNHFTILVPPMSITTLAMLATTPSVGSSSSVPKPTSSSSAPLPRSSSSAGPPSSSSAKAVSSSSTPPPVSSSSTPPPVSSSSTKPPVPSSSSAKPPASSSSAKPPPSSSSSGSVAKPVSSSAAKPVSSSSTPKVGGSSSVKQFSSSATASAQGGVASSSSGLDGTPNPDTAQATSGMTTGAKVAVGVGVTVGVILLIIAAVLFWMRSAHASKREPVPVLSAVPSPQQQLAALPVSNTWVKKFDTTHNTIYYHNPRTGVSQWEKPEGFVERPVPPPPTLPPRGPSVARIQPAGEP